jgi:hypothetical protein
MAWAYIVRSCSFVAYTFFTRCKRPPMAIAMSLSSWKQRRTRSCLLRVIPGLEDFLLDLEDFHLDLEAVLLKRAKKVADCEERVLLGGEAIVVPVANVLRERLTHCVEKAWCRTAQCRRRRLELQDEEAQ